MTNIKFKRFNQPGVLAAIPVKHVYQFFQYFDAILREGGRFVPHQMAGSEDYYKEWIKILNSPENLPDAFVEALLEMEDMAAPQNRARLEEAVAQGRITSVWLDPKDPPECQAFQLWLIAHPVPPPTSQRDSGRFRRTPKMSEVSPSTGQSTTPFKRFSQTEVLATINRKHLFRFFDHFKGSFMGARLPLPHAPPSTEDYCPAWSAILKSPQPLPADFNQAVLAIEELSAPENRTRLQTAVNLARVANPWLNPNDSPECLALQLWNLSPYKNLQDVVVPSTQTTPLSGPPPLANPPLPAHAPPLAHPMGEGSRVRVPVESGGGAEAEAAVPLHKPSVAPAPAQGGLVAPKSDEGGLAPPKSAQGGLAAPKSDEGESPILTPQFSPGSEAQSVNSELPTLELPSYHRHNGKVGRLPNKVRESINWMLYDNVPFATIIERLGEAGKGLNRGHLTSWKKGGYREWLALRQREDRTRAKQQFAFDMLREQGSSKLHEASLQIASSHLGEFLADLDSTVLRKMIEADPLNFVRVLTVLTKLSESGIKCEAHRVAMAERQAALEKGEVDPADKCITEETLNKIQKILMLH